MEGYANTKEGKIIDTKINSRRQIRRGSKESAHMGMQSPLRNSLLLVRESHILISMSDPPGERIFSFGPNL